MEEDSANEHLHHTAPPEPTSLTERTDGPQLRSASRPIGRRSTRSASRIGAPAKTTESTTSQSRRNNKTNGVFTAGVLTALAALLLATEVLSPISPPLFPWPTTAFGIALIRIGWNSSPRHRFIRLPLGVLIVALGLGGMRVPLISALNFRNKRVLDQISIDAAGELQIHESEGPCITEDLPGRLTVDRTLTPPRITYVVKYRDFGKLCATFTTFTAQAPKGIAAGMTLQDLSGRIYVLGP